MKTFLCRVHRSLFSNVSNHCRPETDFHRDRYCTHHITFPCLLLTCRCRSGHPKQATSQSRSGQLYRSRMTVSSKISSRSYLIPRLSSVRAISASVNCSYRFAGSSVNITKLDSVLSDTVLANVQQQVSLNLDIPDSAHTPSSCRALSTSARRYGKFDGCKARRTYARLSMRR